MMVAARAVVYLAALIHVLPVRAFAQELEPAEDAPARLSQPAEQLLYKGMVGNVLDVLPIDPQVRVDLQRTNAVVSNTFLGRSLGVMVGIGGPVLIIGGLIWGMWAASRIRPVAADAQLPVPVSGSRHVTVAAELAPVAEVSGRKPGATGADVLHDTEPEVRPLVVAEGEGATQHHPVVRVWLPQPRDW